MVAICWLPIFLEHRLLLMNKAFDLNFFPCNNYIVKYKVPAGNVLTRQCKSKSLLSCLILFQETFPDAQIISIFEV